MSFIASWNPYDAYAVGDTVNYQGADYTANIANLNVAPNLVGPTWSIVPSGGVTNPLTSDLDAATFDILNGGQFNATTLGTENLVIMPGSLATRIDCQTGLIVSDVGYGLRTAGAVHTDSIETNTSGTVDITSPLVVTNPTVPAQFTIPPQTSVAPTVANDLTNKSYVDSVTASLAGLFNTLRIVPTAAGLTSSSTYYSGGSGIGYPSSWYPDTTPNIPNLPTAGTGNSWRLTKPAGAGGSGQRWWTWLYNPQYGNSPPFSAPSTTFLKTDLNALYAVIRVKTANLNVQGEIFWNIYTYDYTTAPNQAYSTRFDYSLNNLALPYTTGALALQTEFTYLIYASDAPKIVANPSSSTTITQCNGQVPGQTTDEMLRDPFDIHTDIPHIPMSAVAYTNGVTVPSNINQVPILALAFGCTSSVITNGVDIELLSVGYRANGGTLNEEFTMLYS